MLLQQHSLILPGQDRETPSRFMWLGGWWAQKIAVNDAPVHIPFRFHVPKFGDVCLVTLKERILGNFTYNEGLIRQNYLGSRINLALSVFSSIWKRSHDIKGNAIIGLSDYFGRRAPFVYRYQFPPKCPSLGWLCFYQDPRPFSVDKSLSIQPRSIGGNLSPLRRPPCLPRLPANYAPRQASYDDQPPIGVSHPLGPFEGCVRLWRNVVGLTFVLSGVGLALFSIRRMKGWLLLFSWLLIWTGIIIALTGHYPCPNQPSSEYRQMFQHYGENVSHQSSKDVQLSGQGYGFPDSSDGSNISRVKSGLTFLPTVTLTAAPGLRWFGLSLSRSENCVQYAASDPSSISLNTPSSRGNAASICRAIFRSLLLPFETTMTFSCAASAPWHEFSIQPSASMCAARSIRTTATPIFTESLNSGDSGGSPMSMTYTSKIVPSRPASFLAIPADCVVVNCLGPNISTILFSSAMRLASASSARHFAASRSIWSFLASLPLTTLPVTSAPRPATNVNPSKTTADPLLSG